MTCSDLSSLPSDLLACDDINKAAVRRLRISDSPSLQNLSLPSISAAGVRTDRVTELVVKSTGVRSLVICTDQVLCSKMSLRTLDVTDNRLEWMEFDWLPNLRHLWLKGT